MEWHLPNKCHITSTQRILLKPFLGSHHLFGRKTKFIEQSDPIKQTDVQNVIVKTKQSKYRMTILFLCCGGYSTFYIGMVGYGFKGGGKLFGSQCSAWRTFAFVTHWGWFSTALLWEKVGPVGQVSGDRQSNPAFATYLATLDQFLLQHMCHFACLLWAVQQA